jgi:type II restriction enzyme
MTIDDLIKMYEDKKKKYSKDAYKHISSLLSEAKERHRQDFLKESKKSDHEQSWRAFKGKNLEKLIEYIIKASVEDLGLKIINGNILERTEGKNLSDELNKVKRNLLVDFGEYGSHLPDIDLVIYEPITYQIISVLSSKVTLRERVAQTGYWKLKLLANPLTKHIKVYFITLDEDGTLTSKQPAKKGRAIVEIDIDGCYILSELNIEESEKVKIFEHFISDLKQLKNFTLRE